MNQFEGLGAQRITIVADERFWVRKLPGGSDQVPFPVLTDSTSTVSATFGLAYQVHAWNGWTSRPAWLVIDRDGIIRKEWRHSENSEAPPWDPLEVVKDLVQK